MAIASLLAAASLKNQWTTAMHIYNVVWIVSLAVQKIIYSEIWAAKKKKTLSIYWLAYSQSLWKIIFVIFFFNITIDMHL